MISSQGMGVGQTIFDTCVWIGRFIEAAKSASFKSASHIFRPEEKIWICNSARAKDSNIRIALIDRFAKFDKRTGRGTKSKPDWFYGVSSDMWMAYAVAVTFLDKKEEHERHN